MEEISIDNLNVISVEIWTKLMNIDEMKTFDSN